MIGAHDIHVVIPSRRRVAEATHCVTLWPRTHVSVCVDEAEAADYKDVGAPVVTHPKVNGLGELRQWIFDNYRSRVIVQCNDDVKALRCLTGRSVRKLTDPNSIMQVMVNSANICDELGISIFCFSPTVVPMRLDPFKPFLFNRIEGALFGQVGRKLRFDPKIKQHDDLDLSLQALMTDRIVWQDARFGPEHNFMTKGGGNSLVRGKDQMEAELKYMKDKWGHWLGILRRDPSLKGDDAKGVPQTSLVVTVPRQQTLDV